MEPSIGVFADKQVGNDTLIFLLKNYAADLKFVVCIDEDSIVYKTLLEFNYTGKIYFNAQLSNATIIAELKNYAVNYVLLAWWPNIIKEPVLSIPTIGVLNFHPSLLPYDRGKNYNFWTIVDGSPFGVSIHFVDEKIDNGDIVFQKEIIKDWTDTGESLYKKASTALLELFSEKYPDIRRHNYTKIPQEHGAGSFHYGKEMLAASKIDLNKEYTALNLLNLLRAKTFSPHPAAWFEDEGQKYEVQINIRKI